MDLGLLMLLLNTVVTIICGIYILVLLGRGVVKRHSFYILFAVGFLVYGGELIIRVMDEGLSLISASLLSLSFMIISLALASLSSNKKLWVYVTSFYAVLSACVFLIVSLGTYPFEKITWMNGLIYVPFISLLVYHKAALGNSADRLLVGGSFLFLTNMLLINLGWLADLFAISSKITMLLGILNYDFLVSLQKVTREDRLRVPVDTKYPREGGIKIVEQSVYSSNFDRFDWTKRKIEKNIELGKTTYVFSFQGDVPYNDLLRMKWLSPQRVFIFLFSSAVGKKIDEFEVFPPDLTKMGAALSEITRSSTTHENTSNRPVIIFTNLSLIIHLFDAQKVYSLLLSKLGAFRESGTELYMFLYPETHDKQNEIALFVNIADETIKK